MKIAQFCFTICLIMLSHTSIAAKNQHIFNLSDTVKFALENAPGLSAERERILMAALAKKNVAAQYYPTVTATANLGVNTDDLQSNVNEVNVG